MPPVPPEIVKMIIELLGNPDRNLLLPLLLVCRGFYEMTHPLLYESISISSAYASKSFDFPPRSPPSTAVAPERFDQLHESLIQNPFLITCITTFICRGRVHHSDSDWSSIRTILPSLTHLQRFAFTSWDGSMENRLFPPASKLTHLSLRTSWDETTYALVRTQPLIEYLELGYIYGGQEQPSSMYPPITLPNLKVLECDILFFNQLEELSALEHLSLLQNDCAPRKSKSISTIRSFKGDTASWGQLARFCDVVEYVWITNCDNYVKDALLASSRQIKYFYGIDVDMYPADCSSLFEAFPDLVVVDVNGPYFEYFRYIRGRPEREVIEVPGFGIGDFRHWHEALVGVVEEATREFRAYP